MYIKTLLNIIWPNI